ncbi:MULTISPECIES: hypothetical protein [unclassified Prosthecochloris]|uniref:hypothetical protein n=1 Tax=unclassified Prosthecochloris TaxID=2632826 RepID=UPI00223CDCC4|nr:MULTISPECIES: hypothetical protein [unclassified Prosthecochloris]UZJ36530.1 hypothetical protein OO005_07085 [Prosthecochloris sp. SCSIO W1103]
MKNILQPSVQVLPGSSLFFFFLAIFLLTSPNALAHKVNLFCWYEGTELHGEGYFSGGNPAQNSSIRVYDLENGNLLASCVTSRKGTFTISLEKKVPIKVVLDAGQGHRASWTWNEKNEQAASTENIHTPGVKNKTTAIAAGLVAIVAFFSFLYLWKQRHAD